MLKTFVSHLACDGCGREFDPEGFFTCPSCGPLKGTLSVRYDMQKARKKLTKRALSKRPMNQWRYLELLPLRKSPFLHPLVGGTPLISARRLSKNYGVEIMVKDETKNPSASLKDRASSVAVAMAMERGFSTVAAASTGNAASSLSLMAAWTGMKSVIFVPETAPEAKLAQILVHGSRVFAVKGSYDEAFNLCLAACESFGWYCRNTGVNPFMLEGKKTVSMEMAEQAGFSPPDAIFVPVGDGCIIGGVWKGMKDLLDLGFLEAIPKIFGVQAQGAMPLVRAFEKGTWDVLPEKPQTIADSIAVGIPRASIPAIRAVRESGGAMIHVTDEEILSAIRDLAKEEGIMAEPAGAAAWAGLRKVMEKGDLPGKRAAILVTGHGLKDIRSVRQAAGTEPIPILPDLEEVRKKTAW